MLIRRGAAAAPLALAAAYLAHVAGFGSSHVLGGIRGTSLAGAEAAALGLLVLAALGAGFLGAFRPQGASRGGLRAFVVEAAVLSVGGSLAFAALEALEGHGIAPWAPAAVAAAAAVVLALARALGDWLVRTGARCADALSVALAALPAMPVRRAAPVALRSGRAAAGSRRGRAPPPSV